MLPWRFELWKSKAWCRQEKSRFRKLTQIAAGMIDALQLPGVGADIKVRVLCDAFYLCPTVTQACEKRGFTYFSVAKRNRCFARSDQEQPAGKSRRGKKSKRKHIGQILPGLIKHEGSNVRMKRSFGWRWMRIASVVGCLRGIGVVRLVGSHRPGMRWRDCLPIVTNEVKLKAREIVSIYERRFKIELMFKELQSQLGLSDYQVISQPGITRHLHLCALAHLLLTHHGMEAIGAQARKATTNVTLPTMSQRLEAMRVEIRQKQIARLFKGERQARLRARLTPYLMAA
jgi:transposase